METLPLKLRTAVQGTLLLCSRFYTSSITAIQSSSWPKFTLSSNCMKSPSPSTLFHTSSTRLRISSSNTKSRDGGGKTTMGDEFSVSVPER